MSFRRPDPVLACSSAQLGQPFGLLRAAAIGLDAGHFEEGHALVQLLRESAAATPAWLATALAAATADGGSEAAADEGRSEEPASGAAAPSAGADG